MSARLELGRLEAGGLIQIAALQPELEYMFRHALVQEAAYATLLKQDRRALHRAAAEAILALHPDRQRELAGVIALHFEQAGENARAAEYLALAGEHAVERFANREAIAYFARALALGDDASPAVRLRAAVGAAKGSWGYTTSGKEVDDLEKAVAVAKDAEPRLLADAYFWIAYHRRQRGELPETSPELKIALEKANEIGRTVQGARAPSLPRGLMGAFAAFTGDLRAGAREMEKALEDLEGKTDPVASAMIADFLAMTYARLGEFKAAEVTVARGHAHAVQADDISRVDIDITRSGIDLERGNLDKASEQALAASTRAESLGAYACVIASNVLRGSASLAMEDPSAAKRPLERGDELCLVTNMAAFQTLTKGLLASSRAQLGDLPAGVAGWNEALESARGMNDRYGEARVLWARGRTFSRQTPPDWGAALADLDEATRLFEVMEARPSLARTLNDRANALTALGRTAEADEVQRRALALGHELGLNDAPFAG